MSEADIVSARARYQARLLQYMLERVKLEFDEMQRLFGLAMDRKVEWDLVSEQAAKFQRSIINLAQQQGQLQK